LLVSALVFAYGISFVAANPGYQDEFADSSLLPFWSFVNPAGTSSYSLTDHSGWCRITAPTGVALATTSNFNAPRLLQPVTGDFLATTCVSGSFSQAGFRAGLLVWKDTSNYMRLEKWGANQALMYGRIAGVETYQPVSLSSNYNPLYLKLEKVGTTLSGYWSQDGITWNLIRQFTSFNAADPVEVGIFVINVGSTPFSADFDYFRITPFGVFVLPESPLGTLLIPIAMGGAFAVYKLKPLSRKVKTASI